MQMKGITCCGDCGYYNWKKHKCTRAVDEGDAYSSFYADCPLPDVVEIQEPRVMTLEEYEAWIDIPFTERNPVFHEERTKRGTVTSWVNTAVCTLREYGKNDRCWTSRPTDEQREAILWN